MGELICLDILCARGEFTLRVDELRLGPGEKIAVLGENGCGKTTLLQVLAGLLPPGGSITRDRERWDELSPAGRSQHLSYLPQESGVLFNLTVEELIELSLAEHRLLGAEARRAALEATEMLGFRQRLYHSLSGGEKRRAMLARVLCRDCAFVFLDEPTAPLDMRHSAMLMRYLADGSAGRTVVAAMHDLNLAARYFDRFLLMKHGKILFDRARNGLCAGELEEIYGIRIKNCGDYFIPEL